MKINGDINLYVYVYDLYIKVLLFEKYKDFFNIKIRQQPHF